MPESGSLLAARHRELLEKLRRVLAPLDSKIDHSLWVGTNAQLRHDLSYLRGLLNEALAAVEEALDA